MAPPEIRAPRGSALTCRSWPQEAAMRMLMNNLDPEVAAGPGPDRYLSPEIEAVVTLVQERRILTAAEGVTGPLN